MPTLRLCPLRALPPKARKGADRRPGRGRRGTGARRPGRAERCGRPEESMAMRGHRVCSRGSRRGVRAPRPATVDGLPIGTIGRQRPMSALGHPTPVVSLEGSDRPREGNVARRTFASNARRTSERADRGEGLRSGRGPVAETPRWGSCVINGSHHRTSSSSARLPTEASGEKWSAIARKPQRDAPVCPRRAASPAARGEVLLLLKDASRSR
jgi:hypothetical protein